MNYPEIPYSVFKESVERARKLAYHPSSNIEDLSVIVIPHSVFEDAEKSAREKAHHPSKRLENQ